MNYEMKCYEGSHPRIEVTDEFIERNNLCLGRSQEEILERIKKPSFMGEEPEVLINYLNRESAKEFYKKEFVEKVDNGTEEKPQLITDIKEATQDFLDYMVFGWMKALDERGISASRTIQKTGVWMWLLGRDDLHDILHDDNLYNPYGMPALIECCEKLGITVPEDCKEFAKHKC